MFLASQTSEAAASVEVVCPKARLVEGWLSTYLRHLIIANVEIVGFNGKTIIRGESGISYTVFASGVLSFTKGRC